MLTTFTLCMLAVGVVDANALDSNPLLQDANYDCERDVYGDGNWIVTKSSSHPGVQIRLRIVALITLIFMFAKMIKRKPGNAIFGGILMFVILYLIFVVSYQIP